MKVADICQQDTGGQSFRCAKAVREHTAHESRSFCSDPSAMYPSEITKGMLTHELLTYLRRCDIVHVHNRYRYANGWVNFNPDVKWVIHRHGRIPSARRSAEDAADVARKALSLVSTLNLLSYVQGDEARWVPAPLELDSFIPVEHEGLRIAHSPTNREYKRTDLLLAAVKQLADEGHAIEVVMIEGRTYAESIALRSACDITYDQLHLCYGNSGLEGMALSQPVIAGMAEDTRETVKRVIGYEPYVFASESTLYGVLKRLVTDAGYRRETGLRGREYVETFHSMKAVGTRLGGIYGSL